MSDEAPTPAESVLSPGVRAHISHAVIATYAADAASEVQGVHALLGGSFGSIERRTDPDRASKAVRVSSSETGDVDLDVHVVVEWEASIPELATDVEEAVRRYLRSMIDLEVGAVTVFVDGLAPVAPPTA